MTGTQAFIAVMLVGLSGLAMLLFVMRPSAVLLLGLIFALAILALFLLGLRSR